MYAGAKHVVFRNFMVAKRGWPSFISGFAEPVLYLFSIGVGMGKLVDGFDIDGRFVTYAAFVAPAMLAASAFNGSLFDSTFNVFFKLKYDKIYDTMIVTPLTVFDIARGEIIWCVARSTLYSTGFLAIMAAMGMVHSWLALLTIPATMLIGFAIASIGMALTTYMKSWQDFEFITLAVTPLTLFLRRSSQSRPTRSRCVGSWSSPRSIARWSSVANSPQASSRGVLPGRWSISWWWGTSA